MGVAVPRFLKTYKQGYRIVLGMMERDEDDRLEAWIIYHSYLFGIENLYIFDNGSTSEIVIKVLEKYKNLGLNINYEYTGPSAFSSKGEILAEKFRELEEQDPNISFFFPLDCDEFLMLKLPNGEPCFERSLIYEYLDCLVLDPHILVINDAYPNILGYPGFFFEAYSHHKVFFARGTCRSLSEGFHTATSRKIQDERLTDLVYLHFHHRPFEDMVRQSERKLEHLLDIKNVEKLRGYQGPGAHVVRFLLYSKEAYLNLFDPTKGVQFPKIIPFLKILGVNEEFINSI